MTITLRSQRLNFSGWYRLRITSPPDALRNIRLQASDGSAEQIRLFDSPWPKGHFSAYLYMAPSLPTVEMILDLPPDEEDPAVSLRPISSAEFLWRCVKRGQIRWLLLALQEFYRPGEPFCLSFTFPGGRRFANEKQAYHWWIKNREPGLEHAQRSASRDTIAQIPKISILLAVANPRPGDLRKAIDSVCAQTSPHWELCIADDVSVNPEISSILDEAVARDKRISLMRRSRYGGISAATNTAFSLASSPYVACLGDSDQLAPTAVEQCARHLADHPECRLLFSDEDKIDDAGQRFAPYFKPRTFSRELFYSSDYINHLTVYDAEVIRGLQGWRTAYDGAHGYDLRLRVLEVAPPGSIQHLSSILYHMRAAADASAVGGDSRPDAVDAGRRALSEHLHRMGDKADVTVVGGTFYRVRRTVPEPAAKVSIIIPFRDRADLLDRCVRSILERTDYPNIEFVLVDNGSVKAETIQLLDKLRENPNVKVVHFAGNFNYSTLNNLGAEASTGEFLCLLNSDTEVINADWLTDMVGYASAPGVGCVGAKLLYPTHNTVQHCGVVLGMRGVANHPFVNFASTDPGYFGRLIVASNYSAVTGACLLVRRSLYFQSGRLDESNLPVLYQDIDLCLKVQALGYQNVVTPFAQLFHYESATRGRASAQEKARAQREQDAMTMRYGDLLQQDPYYSPHLSLNRTDFSLRVD